MSIENQLAYREWLRTSFAWGTIRLIALVRAEHRCCICAHASEANHAHHICYRRIWNETRQRDVRVLCADCHKRIHEITHPGRVGEEFPTISIAEFIAAAIQIQRERNVTAYVLEETTTQAPCRICSTANQVIVINFPVIHASERRQIGVCDDCFSVYNENPGDIGKLFRWQRETMPA